MDPITEALLLATPSVTAKKVSYIQKSILHVGHMLICTDEEESSGRASTAA
jgi:hypothetical protein